MNTVWIDLGCPMREMEFARFFQEAGCQILFFRVTAVGFGRIVETIAVHRLALERMADQNCWGGKDLLLVSVNFPESVSAEKYLADFMEDNSHREYYLGNCDPAPLKNFFKPSVAVILPADKPDEILRRWHAKIGR